MKRPLLHFVIAAGCAFFATSSPGFAQFDAEVEKHNRNHNHAGKVYRMHEVTGPGFEPPVVDGDLYSEPESIIDRVFQNSDCCDPDEKEVNYSFRTLRKGSTDLGAYGEVNGSVTASRSQGQRHQFLFQPHKEESESLYLCFRP